MFITVRQLEDLHRQNGSNGHVTLPYRARLTPLAQDWVRSSKIAVGYADVDATSKSPTASSATLESSSKPAGKYLWWCDGPCGPAKAAIASLARETNAQANE